MDWGYLGLLKVAPLGHLQVFMQGKLGEVKGLAEYCWSLLTLEPAGWAPYRQGTWEEECLHKQREQPDQEQFLCPH